MKTLLLLLCLLTVRAHGAVGFNGTTTMLTTTPITFGSPLPLSVSAWIYITGVTEATVGVITEMGSAFTFYVGDDKSFSVQALFSPTPMYKSAPASTLGWNVWNQIGFTWDGGTNPNGLILYTNGVAIGGTLAGGTGSGTIAGAAYTLCIGNRLATTVTFNGYIADVAMWTNVLTAAEMATLAGPRVLRRPLTIRPETMLGYWPLDAGPEGSTLVAYQCLVDMSRYSRHATPSNAAVVRPSILTYP